MSVTIIENLFSEFFSNNDQINFENSPNFFELGGDSIELVELIFKINQKFSVELPLNEVIKLPTPEHMYNLVKSSKFTRKEQDVYYSEEAIPLMQHQEDMLEFEKQVGMHFNHLSHVLLIEGALDKKVLENSFNYIVRNHSSLRMKFRQDTHSQWESEYHESVIKEYHCDEQKDVKVLVNQLEKKEFNLFNEEYLLRLSLIYCKNKTYLSFVIHHLIIDGHSLNQFEKALFIVYSSFERHEIPRLLLPQKNFSQIIQTVKKNEKRVNTENVIVFEECEGIFPLIESDSFVRKTRNTNIKLSELNSDGFDTLFGYFLTLSLLGIFLLTGKTSFHIGIPILNRIQGSENIYGNFASIMPVNIKLNPNWTYDQLKKYCLNKIKEIQTSTYNNSVKYLNTFVEVIISVQHVQDFQNVRSPLEISNVTLDFLSDEYISPEKIPLLISIDYTNDYASLKIDTRQIKELDRIREQGVLLLQNLLKRELSHSLKTLELFKMDVLKDVR